MELTSTTWEGAEKMWDLLTKIEVTMGPDLLQLFQFLNLKIHLIQQIIQQILFINNFVGLDVTTS